MKKLIIATLLLGSTPILSAQKTMKLPAVYKPVKTEMYKKGWIDFNKNGIKDVYEDPTAPIDARIEEYVEVEEHEDGLINAIEEERDEENNL